MVHPVRMACTPEWNSHALPSEHRMYKIGHAPSLLKAIEAQSMFDDTGGDGDENGRVLCRVVSDSTGPRRSPRVTHSFLGSATPHYFKPRRTCRMLSMESYEDLI